MKAHFTQLGRLYNALEDRSHDPDDAQGIGEAWPSAVEVLAQCASLHTLALIDCPLPVAQVLFRRLPDGLDSLSALLLHDEPGNYYFELPDISRLASLRNITFLRTSLTEDTMRRLSQTASITYMGVYPNRGGRYSPYTWLLLHSGIVHLRLFGRVDPEPQPANLVFLDCVDVMINSDMALGQYIEGKLPIPLAELQHRGLSISIMDTRDDSGQIDALGTLYDNWIAALGPAAGCVQLRDAHVRPSRLSVMHWSAQRDTSRAGQCQRTGSRCIRSTPRSNSSRNVDVSA